MKRGKHKKEKFKIIEAYSVLILIAALFICIGYASISGMEFDIEGKVDTSAQTGVFITNVSYISDNEADKINSKINYYLGTVLDSEMILGNANESSITYQVTIYNSTDIEQLFIDVLTDASIPNSYTNENIEFTLSGIEKSVTTIASKESLSFTITFKYKENADTTNNILKSILNFRFQENPILILSNEGETYTLNDIYPDYIAQEYQFTVSNYSEKGTNDVPMTYYFETKIDRPLIAKIYDENGNEVTDGVNIVGDGITQNKYSYTLKIIWDNSNPEENVEYNSQEYANKQFNCMIELKASPSEDNSKKYLQYTMSKKFNIDIITEPFYFETNIDNQNIEFSNNRAELNLIIKNNNGDDINKNTTTYKILLENNDKFTLYINGEKIEGNETTRELEGQTELNNVLEIELIPNQDVILDTEETCNLKIESINLYKKIIDYQITITKDLGINPTITSEMTPIKYKNGNWVEADPGIDGDWYDYTYQKWANVETDNGYFVYIPRYAYKITSGYHTSQETAGTMAIVFLNEDNTAKTTKDSEGNIVTQSDIVTSDQVNSGEEGVGINATTKYIVHPAFTAFDTTESNIDGIWVAKYEMSMESTSDGGNTWSHKNVSSETIGNVSIVSDSTKRMVSKPGVSSWRYIDVTNIFDNCYNMNRNLDSHMMKNTEWGAITYLSMSKYGKGAVNEVEHNTSTSYLTGYGSSGTLSTGAASTSGTMYGVFDMAGGSYEYVAGYLDDECIKSTGTRYSVNKSLILADAKYKDVYSLDEWGSTTYAFLNNYLKVGDGLWEISEGTLMWFNHKFDYVGISSADNDHYPVFDRGGDYGSWTSQIGINYTGRNSGVSHPGVTFRAVFYVK